MILLPVVGPIWRFLRRFGRPILSNFGSNILQRRPKMDQEARLERNLAWKEPLGAPNRQKEAKTELKRRFLASCGQLAAEPVSELATTNSDNKLGRQTGALIPIWATLWRKFVAREEPEESSTQRQRQMVSEDCCSLPLQKTTMLEKVRLCTRPKERPLVKKRLEKAAT